MTGKQMARILVAEDDDNVRRFVVQALSIHGHDVTEAEAKAAGRPTKSEDD